MADKENSETGFPAQLAAFREGSRAFREHKPGQQLEPAEIAAEATRIHDFAQAYCADVLRSVIQNGGALTP